jgi:LmbE family N-acetylglucosaminyl deacetylase
MDGPHLRQRVSVHPVPDIGVISPHLDDAALSLGATLRAHTLGGSSVRIITVLANDPQYDGPPGEWDAECGFASAAEAAVGRRAEDEAACKELGAEPVWLPFGDMEYPRGATDDEVAEAAWKAVSGCDLVLLPGWPLLQPDHAWLHDLLLAHRPEGTRIGLYVEQPYAALRLLGRGGRTWSGGITASGSLRNAALLGARAPGRCRPPAGPDGGGWEARRAGSAARKAKWRAVRRYTSQVAGFGPLVLERIRLYEWGCGGEQVSVEPPSSG